MQRTMAYRVVSFILALLVSAAMPVVSSAEEPIDSTRTDSSPHVTAVRTTESSDSSTSSEEPNPASILVVAGTKIPIVMASAVNSATGMEGDEFLAKIAVDVVVDGSIALPAGAVIKGRIGCLGAPDCFKRRYVELHFDYVASRDNQDIPLAAIVVTRAGIAHVHRGLKDIAIAVKAASAPVALGTATSYNPKDASRRKNRITTKEEAAKDVSAGWTVGTIAPVAVTGKEVDLKVGDELRIELTKDLRMTMKQ